MIRGIRFTIPQETTNTLWKILNRTRICNCTWYNVEDQCEVWTNTPGQVFFNLPSYNAKDFEKKIQQDHYIIFLKLLAYPEGERFFNIHTYKDFQNSRCQLLLLIYDCEFVEIFVKSTVIAEIIFNNASLNNYKNIEYITDNNDKRTILDIL